MGEYLFDKTAILSFKDAELYYKQLMNFPAVTQPL